MIEIPGGTFTMGSPVAGGRTDDAEHEVTVSGFAMCRTEITQKQWRSVMGSDPSDRGVARGQDLPVYNVTWLEVVEYLNALSRLQGLSPCYQRETRNYCYLPPVVSVTICDPIPGEVVRWPDRACEGYRLPTEAEWEYATRARTKAAYYFGDDPGALGEYAWFKSNAGGKVHPVGTRRANPFGLQDLYGNVSEMVWDWYGPYDTKNTVDPTGPEQGTTSVVMDRADADVPVRHTRVLRGGAYTDAPSSLRSAFRGSSIDEHRGGTVGFRCARSLATPNGSTR